MKVMRFLFSIIFGISLCDELKDPCSNEGKISGPKKTRDWLLVTDYRRNDTSPESALS